ncbi:CpsD/CapB family tyrosine-protein kinase [Tessaracoccus massiliensis]|uniref:CpsD/CapB family tyrosine-protein kinase n=1 Tax=Tessaracoccus massiliensis TaxID=1522311 RepID=UPI000694CB82|nr:CpsD/CapB family tyrosine-protein kinase [Tessaracoccus massiliensis]
MTLIDLVRLLRKNFLILLLCAALGVGLAAAWTLTRPAVYTTSAVGLVVAGDTQNLGNATFGDAVAQQRAAAYAALVNTRAVGDRAAEILAAMPEQPAMASYTASVDAAPAFIRVTATADNGLSAQATADAVLQGLIDEALRLETYSQTQTMENPPEDPTSLTALHIMPYETASLPTVPQQADLTRNLLVGLLAGLALGVGVAIMRRQLDIRVRTQTDVEELTGHAVLGIVPETKEMRRESKGGGLATGAAAEALRKLRTNLRFVQVDNPPRAIVITSANPAEGKSTVAANLARLLAQAEQRTVIVDADLRRPTQAKHFGLDGSVGLSQVLAGDVPVRDALQATETPLLQLLPAGRIPPNPSELVGSRHMAAMIRELSKDAMVIIDAPPLLPVTDAGLLAAAADGAILVVRVGKTFKEQVQLATKMLHQVDAKLLGSVMNLASRTAMGEVVYGYGRSYGYSSTYQYYGEGDGKKGRRSKQKKSKAAPARLAPAAEAAASEAVRPSRAIPADES